MSRRVILGLRPSWGVHKEITNSSTTRRLDLLQPDWRESFETRNVYASHEPGPGDESPHDIVNWLDENRVDIVVTLGQEVARIISRPIGKAPWLSVNVVSLNFAVRHTTVFKFPHPSGRNRWYNDQHNVEQARRLLWAASIL